MSAGDLANVDLYQDVAGQPGIKYMLTGWAGAGSSYSGLLVGGATHSLFAIDFLNSSQAVIGGATLDLQPAGLGNPNGNPFGYAQYSVSAVAPAGTAFVRSRSSMINGFNNSPGDQAFVVDSFDLAPIQTSSAIASGTWTAASGVWNTPNSPNNGNGGFEYDVTIGNPFTVTIPAATNIDIDGLTLGGNSPGGTIVSNGSLTVHAATNWTTGTLAGSGTVNLIGPTTISGNGVKTISGAVINSGTMTWQGGQVGFIPAGAAQPQLINWGTIQLQGDGAFLSFGGGQPSFVNQAGGTLRQLSGPGISTIDVATTNHGQIQVDSSTMSFTRGLTIDNGGNIQLSNGTLSSSQTVAVNSGGQLSGNGTVTGNVAVGTDAGPQQATFSPGVSAGGAFAVNGNYHQGANGVFLEKINGRAAGQFAVTNVSGTAQVGGTLRVDITNLNATGLYPYAPITILTSSGLDGTSFPKVETIGNHLVKFVPSYPNGPGAGAGDHSGGASSTGLVSGYLGYAGDVSGDGVLSTLDITAFAEFLVNPVSFVGDFISGIPSLADVDGWDPGNPTAPCGNSVLDFDDVPFFATLLSNEGVPVSAASVYAAIDAQRNVPEPSSAVLMLCAGGVLLAYYASQRIRENRRFVAFRKIGEIA
ncbi:MAG TPA: hypothetical protein VGM76_01270 [Lacipirellulaceae bacterium]